MTQDTQDTSVEFVAPIVSDIATVGAPDSIEVVNGRGETAVIQHVDEDAFEPTTDVVVEISSTEQAPTNTSDVVVGTEVFYATANTDPCESEPTSGFMEQIQGEPIASAATAEILANTVVFDESHYYRLRAGTIATLPISTYVATEEDKDMVGVLVEGGVHNGSCFPVSRAALNIRYEEVGNHRWISRLFKFKSLNLGEELEGYRCVHPSLVAFVDGEPIMSSDLTRFDQAAFDNEFISVGADLTGRATALKSHTGKVVMLGAQFSDAPIIGFKNKNRYSTEFLASFNLQHGPVNVVGVNGVNVVELVGAAILMLKQELDVVDQDSSTVLAAAKLQEAWDLLNDRNAPSINEAEEKINED